MEIANKSLLVAVIGGLNKYTVKDKKYTISAIPITTTKFGPSGSLNNQNSTFEHAIDVTPKISNGAFLNLEYIFVIISEIYVLGDLDSNQDDDFQRVASYH